MASAQYGFVCYKCIQRSSATQSLLVNGCDSPNEHGGGRRVKAWWWEDKRHLEISYPQYPGGIPQIRPVPFAGRRYILCSHNCQCKRGIDCTYAHSIEERDIWNGFSRGPQASQVASMSTKPREEHPRRHPTRKASEITGEPAPQANRKQPSSKKVIQECLTQRNYKQKFQELLNLEEQAHADILAQRCDGKYALVLDFSNSRHYLSGLDVDQIQYAAQASQGVELTISSLGVECSADILPENYYSTENKLFIEFDRDEKIVRKLQPVSNQECHAKFVLKYSYFNTLKKSIANISPELIQRILPTAGSFRKKALSTIANQKALDEQLENCYPDQQKALKAIAHCHPSDPPFLITGPYGTGKTRLLAITAHYFFQESQDAEPVRVLVCTQQNVSADAFLDCFNDLTTDRKQKVEVLRVISDNRYNKKPQVVNLKGYSKQIATSKHSNALVITTCSSSLSLLTWSIHKQGYFTHILIDEGAQMREPEAIAPLCLADKGTRIVIVGDQHQVGPALLVHGDSPQKYGLAVSLLERLHALYTTELKEAAVAHHAMLVTNHRCHEKIVKLSGFLIYDADLTSSVPPTSTHPDAPYPFLFVCSNLDDSRQPVQIKPTEVKKEVTIALQQMKRFSSRWPTDGWGKKDFSQFCFASPTRIQVGVAEDVLKNSQEFPSGMEKICKRVTYTMQGHEFRALFLSTAEPTLADGTTRNPTKSICDRFVFNTVLSRARSLVVCVGNPFVLLRMEMHMQKKYGDKGKCWSNYLRLCIEHGTLSVDEVGLSEQEIREILEVLELRIRQRLGEPKQRTAAPLDSPKNITSDVHEVAYNSATESVAAVDGFQSPSSHQAHKFSSTRLEAEYEVLGHLGKGGFGLVLHVRKKLEKAHYAMKIIKLPNDKGDQDKVLREVEALANLGTTVLMRVVRYFTSWIEKLPIGWVDMEIWKDLKSTEQTYTPLCDQAPYTLRGSSSDETVEAMSQEETTVSGVFDEENVTSTAIKKSHSKSLQLPNEPPTCLFIQTELCKEETLKDWLNKHIQNRPRKKVFKYFVQILEAVDAIHRKGLVHRDLKPSNIFFSTENDSLKVGDFGLVVSADQGSLSNGKSGDCDTVSEAGALQCDHTVDVGTRLYMSPEQLVGKMYNNKVDMFALGLIFIELNYPFVTQQEKVKVLSSIVTSMPTDFVAKLPDEATFLWNSRLLAKEPGDRPTAKSVLVGDALKLLKVKIEGLKETEMVPTV